MGEPKVETVEVERRVRWEGGEREVIVERVREGGRGGGRRIEGKEEEEEERKVKWR